MSKRKKRLIGVLDVETDPFLYGRVPAPFCAEFHSDKTTIVKWGDNCIDELLAEIVELPDIYLIYAHNGGKFDFMFMIPWLENPLRMIKSRIVAAKIGKHECRDSYAIIPVPLKTGGGKLEIDYEIFERPKREKHKRQILEYLHVDCVELLKLTSAFVERFGPKLTVGSTAMEEIQKRHTFVKMSRRVDEVFRPFYYGGRVEVFKGGISHGGYKVFDINSAYPKAMRDYLHPASASFDITRTMPDNFDRPFFMHFTGRNRGALPVSDKDGLHFDRDYGEFFACSHEIKVALKYNLIDIERVHKCFRANHVMNFQAFVDEFYALKLQGKLNNDIIEELFAKFMLNSGYGKFGQNPDNFADHYLCRSWTEHAGLAQMGYEMTLEYEEYSVWSKPANPSGDEGFFNVSIAASITSATRSMLLEAIQHAKGLLYCDTDSLICRDFEGEISETTLGGWKLEKTAPSVAIAGKKLYALYDPANRDMVRGKIKPIKLTSKGGTLKLPDMLKLCRGQSVRYENQAPTFSLTAKTKFIHRNFKSTVAIDNEMEESELPD